MEARATALRAVAEALLPPLPERAAEAIAAGDEAAAALFRHAGGSHEVVVKVLEIIETRLPVEPRRELHLLLRLLGSRLGSLLLLGWASFSGFGLPCAYTGLPLAQREAVLLGWATGADARMRKAFKGLKQLIMSVAFTHLDPAGASDLLAALRYPIIDPDRPPAPAPAAAAAEAAVAAALVDLSGSDASPGSAAGAGAALAAKGLRVTWPKDFGSGSAAIARERPQLAVQCDVVVVGSGAGGGVAAANLARAGLRVVVLEKAGFVPASKMTLQEGEAFQTMYEQAGILATEDGAVSVLAGATLGGGTRVNWCASFRTPAHVRREWAEEHGLPAFAGKKYDRALDAVCARLGVRTGFSHSAMCSTLATGLQGVGVHCGDVPRNCLSNGCSGHCCFGCARGHKQDSVNTWLADACQAGARIVTGAWAERVLLEPCSGGSSGEAKGHVRRRRAVGVLALAGSSSAPLRLAIQAPVVISAAGSLHSPALLQRSRVTCGGAVGANLRLHPCTCVVGLFPAERTSGGEPGVRAGSKTGTRQAGAGPSAAARAAALPDMEDLGGRAAGSATVTAPQGSPAAAAAAPGDQHSLHAGQMKQQGEHAERAQQRRLSLLPASAGPGPGSIRCWEGALMSIFSTHVGDWEGSGYGSLLYTPSVHPGLFAAAGPWLGGADFKSLMLQYPNCCVVLVLVRDSSGAGKVVADRSGRPRLHYSLAPEDTASMAKGVDLGLRCLAAAGATTVMTLLNSPAGRFTFEGTDDRAGGPAAATGGAAGGAAQAGERGGDGVSAPAAAVPAGQAAAFEDFLADVARTGPVPLQMPLFSAHQMGTCRLGADPAASVLDPSGECWEAAGLYCMDGSTFPTPTGVNPMITIEAISYMLSRQLAERLAGKQDGAAATQGSAAAAGSKL
ncbi:hypothetical protein ABPG77_001824 [Micractinium sp. CCAP 211/92]